MEPMTLDKAKLIADCNRRLPGRASTGAPEATVVLAAALRESEARVEAAEKRAANAKREAFEEAARVADAEAAESDRIAKEEQGGRMWMDCRDAERNLAAKIRALAPAPEAKADPLFEDVKRASARLIPKQVLYPATPAFDARKFAEALVEGLSPPRGVAFHPEDPAVYHVRQAVMRAVAIAAGSEP